MTDERKKTITLPDREYNSILRKDDSYLMYGTVPTDQEVWLRAWVAVAGVSVSDIETTDVWADNCLKSYKERFGK